MIRGTPKFDGVAVLEGEFNFLSPTISLKGKAAFISTKTGDTHGWTTNTGWSKETIAKLQELRALMELDLGRLHLETGDPLATSSSGVDVVPQAGDDGGLGSHLGSG